MHTAASSSSSSAAGGGAPPQPSVQSSTQGNSMTSWSLAKVFKDKHRITGLDFDFAGDHLITSSADDTIRLYDVDSASIRKTIYSKTYGVKCVRFTHHVPTIICASTRNQDHSIRYLALHDNAFLRFFEGHRKQVTCLEMHPLNDQFMSAALDKECRLWDLRTSGCQAVLETKSGTPFVRYAPDGIIFAVAQGGNQVKLYDSRRYDQGPFETFHYTSQNSALPPSVEQDWTSLALSDDGKALVLSTTRNEVVVLDSFKGKTLRSWVVEGPPNSILNAEYSPDSKVVCAACEDGNVRFWDAASLPPSTAPCAILEAHPNAVSFARWNPMKRHFVSAGANVAFWIPPQPGETTKTVASVPSKSIMKPMADAPLIDTNGFHGSTLPPPAHLFGNEQGASPSFATPPGIGGPQYQQTPHQQAGAPVYSQTAGPGVPFQHPPNGGAPPQGQGQYPPPQGQYPPPQGQFPPQQQGQFPPPQQGQFPPPQQGQFPPYAQQQGAAPPQQGFNPQQQQQQQQQQQYPQSAAPTHSQNSRGGMSPRGGNMPPSHGQYPPNNAPQQQAPFQYNQQSRYPPPQQRQQHHPPPNASASSSSGSGGSSYAYSSSRR